MRTRLLALALTMVVAGLPGATTALAQTAAPTRRPDVIYVPTPEPVVEAMLQVANVTKNDVVYDLGCGDGRIPVTAAKKYGARGVCFDIDPERIKEANENVAKNNVGNLVRVVQADAETDERAQARHAHCLARLRHGRLEAGEGARCRRPQGLLLDDSEEIGHRAVRPSGFRL